MESRTYIDGNGISHKGLVHYKAFTPKIRGIVKRYAKGSMTMKNFLKANLV